MTTLVIEHVHAPVVPRLNLSGVRVLAWRAIRWFLVGYCLLGLVSYAPQVDAKGHCDCPICQLP